MKTKHQIKIAYVVVVYLALLIELARRESSCGHKIEEATPKQTRANTVGEIETKQTNREGSRQKEADVKVACRGLRRQEGIQKRKQRNKRQTKVK